MIYLNIDFAYDLRGIASQRTMSEEKKRAAAEHPYSDWMKKIHQASNPKPLESGEEKETRHKIIHKNNATHVVSARKSRTTITISLIFLVSLFVRLFFLFFITNPQNAGVGWYNDSYHHWQIAYLSKEIGLGQGFLRLWDLTGLEYFWGFLQPILLVAVFALAGSADIVLSRIFNSLLGSLSAVILFLLIKKHFTFQAALGAALLAIINPVGIFTDTSGMQEPLAILLMLLGVYFWPEKPVLTGISWLLASMARSEYWLFSVGLLAVIVIFDKHHQRKFLPVFPYVAGIIFYMKYLLDKTGNAIYPIYWNFLGNAAGEWQADVPLTGEQEGVRLVFLVILLVSAIVAVYLVLKKPRLYIFSLLGIGNLIFLASFIGLTQYLKSYLPRFWVDRIFLLPYLWLGAMIAVCALYFLPRIIPYIGRIFGWIIVISIAVLLQLAWLPINYYRSSGDNYLYDRQKIAGQIASYYKEGSILIPGNDPILTYQLYKNGIKGAAIRGEMFDPYYYITDVDPYSNWKKNQITVLKWLDREDIHTIVFSREADNRYAKLVEAEAGLFINVGEAGEYKVYEYLGNNK